MFAPQQLQQVKDRLENGEDHVLTTPREIIGRQVRNVRVALAELSLETSPDFEGSGFDETISIRNSQARLPSIPTTTCDPNQAVNLGAESVAEPRPVVDPIHRVSRFLPTAALVTVSRDEEAQVAITKMMLHDFSQLPVMQGDSKVSGMVSWRSIGQRRSLGCDAKYVRDCLETHFEVKAEDSIFDAIRVIQERDCVLVRSKENKIAGILTATDISVSFEQLSRPFLLLSYVENHLRALIAPRFTVDELQSAKDPMDTERKIIDVSAMTFGEYVRLLENPTNWSKLGINLERSLFVNQLNEVREIRNDVMHFNPEGIEEKDMLALRRFSSFLESIVSRMPKH
jgi:CBS domain-containing protein